MLRVSAAAHLQPELVAQDSTHREARLEPEPSAFSESFEAQAGANSRERGELPVVLGIDRDGGRRLVQSGLRNPVELLVVFEVVARGEETCVDLVAPSRAPVDVALDA